MYIYIYIYMYKINIHTYIRYIDICYDLRELATASERHIYSGAVDRFGTRVHVAI